MGSWRKGLGIARQLTVDPAVEQTNDVQSDSNP